MYQSSYDEYIRSILGYAPAECQAPYENNNSYDMSFSMNYPRENNSELEECYPEIYKVVYPMVRKKCQMVTTSVTRELVENMTDEIYLAIEGNNEVNVNINLKNNVRSNPVVSNEKVENRPEVEVKQEENRSPRPMNRGLRDIIKILLLRELLGGGRPPIRPPRPRPPFPGPGGGRPPFPGGPGPVRPPIMPRDYDLYEM